MNEELSGVVVQRERERERDLNHRSGERQSALTHTHTRTYNGTVVHSPTLNASTNAHKL